MSSSSPSAVAEAGGTAAPWAALRAGGLWDLLSERGRRAHLADGIRAWVERARAADVDATIGVLAGTERELGDALEDPALAGEASTIFYLSRVRAQFPDLPPPEIFPYTPILGTRAFREAWRGWLLRKSAAAADPERVRELTAPPVATPGVSGALFTAGHLLLDPGEALVMADKRWDGYDTTFVTVLGARAASHRLFTAEGRLDLEDFERTVESVLAAQPKATAIVNFPNNPTGFMPSRPEVEELAARVRALLDRTRKPLVLLFDDAYEGYVYDPAAYLVSPFYAFVGLHPLCWPLKCDGITKEMLFFGGRLGALTLGLPEAPADRAGFEAEWENKCSAVLRAIVSSVSTPVQGMIARLLRDRLDEALAERERMIALLRARSERLRGLLDAPAARGAFRADPFNSGFFAFLNLRAGSAQEVALRALREHRVGVVPMENQELGINALRLTFGSVSEAKLERLVAALVASAGA